MLVFMLMVCAQSALATTYYVAPSGSDSNAGTSSSSPWQTISRVNALTYKPGDSILFQGGSSFSGSLYMAPASAGTASSPITVGSYGTGRATISPGSNDAFYAYDNGGFQLSNLNFNGSGPWSNNSSGVLFYNDLPGNVKEPHIHVSNVNVSNFGHQGISIGGWNGSSGYTDVNLSHVTASRNGLGGVELYGEANYANTNVYLGSVIAHDNLGKAGLANNSGNGIVLGSVNGGTVEYSIADNNGQNNTSTSGPVGIWAYDSNAVVIEHCQSYSNHTNGGDGDGFDLDINTTNSTIQYSYSHNNDGAGFLLDQNTADNNWSSNTLRYNVSENDARKISFGAITLYGRVDKAEIYGNTVYNTTAPTGTARAVYIFNSGAPGGAVAELGPLPQQHLRRRGHEPARQRPERGPRRLQRRALPGQ